MSVTVTLEPRPERVRIFLGDTLVADSTASVVVHETGLPPRRYVPPGDVELHLFARGAEQFHCPHKGEWAWLNLRIGDKLFEKAAWSYFEATEVCKPIEDFVAFDEAIVTGHRGTIDVG